MEHKSPDAGNSAPHLPPDLAVTRFKRCTVVLFGLGQIFVLLLVFGVWVSIFVPQLNISIIDMFLRAVANIGFLALLVWLNWLRNMEEWEIRLQSLDNDIYRVESDTLPKPDERTLKLAALRSRRKAEESRKPREPRRALEALFEFAKRLIELLRSSAKRDKQPPAENRDDKDKPTK